MNKEIRIVDQEKNIVQITTPDERWYVKDDKEFVPSVTWITHFYPKGVAYMQWLAKHGWDEAEAIKTEAGDKGTIVHHAVEKLLSEGSLKMEDKIADRDGVEREMTADEYWCVITFSKWWNENKPTLVLNERVVWGEGYAGTVDMVVDIGGQLWIIDLKTSQSVWPSHELQVSAYKHALPMMEDSKLAILQLGYRRNKDGFKFTEIEDQFPLFLSTKEIWAKETAGEKPHQKDYPLSINITTKDAEF